MDKLLNEFEQSLISLESALLFKNYPTRLPDDFLSAHFRDQYSQAISHVFDVNEKNQPGLDETFLPGFILVDGEGAKVLKELNREKQSIYDHMFRLKRKLSSRDYEAMVGGAMKERGWNPLQVTRQIKIRDSNVSRLEFTWKGGQTSFRGIGHKKLAELLENGIKIPDSSRILLETRKKYFLKQELMPYIQAEIRGLDRFRAHSPVILMQESLPDVIGMDLPASPPEPLSEGITASLSFVPICESTGIYRER